jgi:hypothetical protein
LSYSCALLRPSRPYFGSLAACIHSPTESFIQLFATAIMSDWIGPNLYRITSYKDRKAAVTETANTNAENGGVAVRYVIKEYQRPVK